MKEYIPKIKRHFEIKIEDRFYAQALNETIEKKVDSATFARAFSDTSGGEEATRALYIKYRASRLQEAENERMAKIREAQRERERQRDEDMTKEILAFRTRYSDSQKLSPEIEAAFWKREQEGEDIKEEIESAIQAKRVSSAGGCLTVIIIVIFILFVVVAGR